MPRIAPFSATALAVLAVGWLASPLAAEPTWQPTPVGARAPLSTWAAHPSGTTLYAEPDRLVRSDDAGRSWRRVPSSPGYGIFSSRLSVHPGNPEIVVAEADADADAGPDEPSTTLVVSRNGGTTWTRHPLPERGSRPIGFDGRGSLYAGQNHRLFRSDDLGVTWADVSPGDGAGIGATIVAFGAPTVESAAGIVAGDLDTWRISIDGGRTYATRPAPVERLPLGAVMAPYDNRRWLVPVTGGVLLTRDAFATAERLQGLAPEANQPQFHPRRPGWLYANYASPSTSNAMVVAFSTDDGASWSHLEIPTRWVDAELVFDPCDDETWYVQSDADGVVRVTATGEVTFLDRSAPHRRVVTAVARPAACELIVETTAGLFALGDRGDTWRRLGAGLAAPAARGFAFDPHAEGRILASTRNGVAVSTDRGRSWDWLPAFDGLNTRSLHFGSTPGRLAWLAATRTLYRSDDGGQTADTVAFPIAQVVADPSAPDELLVQAADGTQAWSRRTDLGATIAHPVATDDEADLDAVAFAPHEPGLLYAYASIGGRFYVSRDGGTSFEQTTIFKAAPVNRGASIRLRVDGDGTIYLFDSVEVARSTDGGATFERLPAIDALAAGGCLVTDVVPDRHAPDTVTVVGVARDPLDGERSLLLWRSDDDGTTFRDDSAGALLPGPEFELGTLGQSPDDPELELFGGRTIYRRDGTDACASPDVLCLRGERFEVSLHFGDIADGTPAIARAVEARTTDSGLFTFFDADNWELMVKVLDGCGLNDRFWILAAATTDQAYTLRLTDRASGLVREVVNAPGRRAPAIIDTDAFASCDTPFPGAIGTPAAPSSPRAATTVTTEATSDGCPDDRLCLQDGRFHVRMRWRDVHGFEDVGLPLDIRSADAGIFAFFSRANWELMVKVLDGCAINGRFWVLGAATTDVGYQLWVTDTRDGSERLYSNPVGKLSPAIIDIDAFPCAP